MIMKIFLTILYVLNLVLLSYCEYYFASQIEVVNSFSMLISFFFILVNIIFIKVLWLDKNDPENIDRTNIEFVINQHSLMISFPVTFLTYIYVGISIYLKVKNV